jgi:hypothetical protein
MQFGVIAFQLAVSQVLQPFSDGFELVMPSVLV